MADYGARETLLPQQVELIEVPFHPQEAYQCGPAALATILGHAGSQRTPAELKDEVYVPLRQGSLQPELLAASRRAGLLPHVLAPLTQALLTEVAAGNPVLVLQDQGSVLSRSWHYAVVVGYDRRAGEIILRSGRERRWIMDFASFDRSWAAAGRWAFVALPPERLPATATEADLLPAAAALERVSPASAGRVYASILQRWPGNPVARIGLGNAAYRRHDLVAAEAAYRQATEEHPALAEAWNNLAQVLHERKQPAAASAAARRALAIGGPREKHYAATLAEIEGRPPP